MFNYEHGHLVAIKFVNGLLEDVKKVDFTNGPPKDILIELVRKI